MSHRRLSAIKFKTRFRPRAKLKDWTAPILVSSDCIIPFHPRCNPDIVWEIAFYLDHASQRALCCTSRFTYQILHAVLWKRVVLDSAERQQVEQLHLILRSGNRGKLVERCDIHCTLGLKEFARVMMFAPPVAGRQVGALETMSNLRHLGLFTDDYTSLELDLGNCILHTALHMSPMFRLESFASDAPPSPFLQVFLLTQPSIRRFAYLNDSYTMKLSRDALPLLERLEARSDSILGLLRGRSNVHALMFTDRHGMSVSHNVRALIARSHSRSSRPIEHLHMQVIGFSKRDFSNVTALKHLRSLYIGTVHSDWFPSFQRLWGYIGRLTLLEFISLELFVDPSAGLVDDEHMLPQMETSYLRLVMRQENSWRYYTRTRGDSEWVIQGTGVGVSPAHDDDPPDWGKWILSPRPIRRWF
ncbi:uncharacterized protein EI90DRAFT_3069228 [Cantharellus anzutake]|uniref:uncharacterized protein n=1 Tax=Cantharellus anzutake TaxID=1750568 RepID=UPI0019089CE6|nr:uncharacterized protein EI90DRAFT_3069228 [Cantharellus anzutake]KAF8326841.1 hypothetical protein EI90DRAFT_3069228 [Cantharellus anzutake]